MPQGLRWLVGLHNHRLNGILADEMVRRTSCVSHLDLLWIRPRMVHQHHELLKASKHLTTSKPTCKVTAPRSLCERLQGLGKTVQVIL